MALSLQPVAAVMAEKTLAGRAIGAAFVVYRPAMVPTRRPLALRTVHPDLEGSMVPTRWPLASRMVHVPQEADPGALPEPRLTVPSPAKRLAWRNSSASLMAKAGVARANISRHTHIKRMALPWLTLGDTFGFIWSNYLK